MEATIYKKNKIEMVPKDEFQVYHEPFPDGATKELNFKLEWPTVNSEEDSLLIEIKLVDNLYAFSILQREGIKYTVSKISLTVPFVDKKAWVPFKLKEKVSNPGLAARIVVIISNSIGELDRKSLVLSK